MYQICVSGAAKGPTVEAGADLAFKVGQELARKKHAVFTGATTGLPYYAAKGAIKQKGQSVGFSPAATKYEHIHKYRLPIDVFDVVLYTGLNYVGRDLLLVQSSDALVSIGGRIGTWHEFTIAFETGKPIAILEGAGGITSEIKDFLIAAGKNRGDVIFETDPKKLVHRLEKVLKEEHRHKKKVH
ncbi:MAG: hypothetical protein WDZ81_00805 [Candidatus Saccharimonadales bacterium]